MKRKDTIFILISSFIVIIAWIIFNIHHNLVSSTVSHSVNIQLNPIAPSFDIKTINAVKQRQSVNVNLQALPQSTPQPSSASSQIPISSQSASISATQGTPP